MGKKPVNPVAIKNKNGKVNNVTIDNHLSQLRFPKGRNHANRCMSILLPVYELWNHSKAKERRLLCILQLRNCSLSAHTDQQILLRIGSLK